MYPSGSLTLSPLQVPYSDSPKGSPLCDLKLFQSFPVFLLFSINFHFSLHCFWLHTVAVQGAYHDVDRDPEREKAVKKKIQVNKILVE